jgi:hypothetical protein
MAHELSPRLERRLTIVASGFWIGGLVLLWSLVRPSPRLLAAILLGSYFIAWGTALTLASRSRSRMVVCFTLTSLAIALPLGCLELLSATGLSDFRTLHDAAGRDPRRQADNAADRELLHIHKPYLKRAGLTRGDIASALHLTKSPLYRFDVAYDRNGFRNARDLSSAEVVVLGDSFVEGGLVATDDLMTTTLGRLLERQVANLGQSGYGPQQELAVLKRYAAPMRPRLCIWTFYEGNDLDDVMRYEQFILGAGRRSSSFERSFGRNALLVLSSGFGRILAPDLSDQAPCGNFRRDDGSTVRIYFRSHGASHSRLEMAALDKVVSVLTAAHAECAAKEIPLLVVFAPEKFRVYKDYCRFRPDNPGTRWVLDNLPEQLRVRVAAIDPRIGFLDLTPALTAEADRGRLLYFADDTHWSAEGHQSAGRAIADDVVRRPDLGLAPRPSPERKDRLASEADGSYRR